MEACITPLPEAKNKNEVAGGALEKWPERAFAVPPRISKGLLLGWLCSSFDEISGVGNECGPIFSS